MSESGKALERKILNRKTAVAMERQTVRQKVCRRKKRMSLLKRKNAVLAAALVFCLCVGMLAGCQKERAAEDDSSFRIVTSFYPLYIMVMNLTAGIDGVEIANMAEPQTGCLHDYQLRPGDLVCLEGADVFLANGGGMEDFLSDVLDTYPSLNILYALDGVETDALLPGEEHAHEGHAHAHEEESGQETVSFGDEDFDHQTAVSAGDLESGEVNPHTWLNPELYTQELSYISSALGELDPVHREQYEQNYLEYKEKIDALVAENEDLKTVTPKRGCVLLHESFAYLADAFGFPVLETVDVEKDSGFSAKEIRTLIDLVEEAGDGIILSDSQYSGRISNLLAGETGMEVYQLDSCVSGEYDKDAWLNSMQKNLEALRIAAQDADSLEE